MTEASHATPHCPRCHAGLVVSNGTLSKWRCMGCGKWFGEEDLSREEVRIRPQYVPQLTARATPLTQGELNEYYGRHNPILKHFIPIKTVFKKRPGFIMTSKGIKPFPGERWEFYKDRARVFLKQLLSFVGISAFCLGLVGACFYFIISSVIAEQEKKDAYRRELCKNPTGALETYCANLGETNAK